MRTERAVERKHITLQCDNCHIIESQVVDFVAGVKVWEVDLREKWQGDWRRMRVSGRGTDEYLDFHEEACATAYFERGVKMLWMNPRPAPKETSTATDADPSQVR